MAWGAIRAAAVVAAALAAGGAAADGDELIARGAAAVARLKSQLLTALQERLAKGPDAAIDVCRVRAPELAVALGTPRERIEALYPGDRATGFREGDFRGIAWAELSEGE